jgi:very-short-patch-repair endonuclease
MRKVKRLPVVSETMRTRAKDLRRKLNDSEKKLWYKINRGKLGVRFLRQRTIGSYIADFISFEVNLVLEVDGSQHLQEQAPEYDKKRDEYLKSLGFRVLRFSNREVLLNIEGVVTEILRNIPPPLTPPLQ